MFGGYLKIATFASALAKEVVLKNSEFKGIISLVLLPVVI